MSTSSHALAAAPSSYVAELGTNLAQADLLVEYLTRVGVEVVFGVPGGAIEPLMNALARSARDGGPRLVVARHECGAAFMAEGYHLETGKLGVVCTTTGPGATNLATGLASALLEESSILAITAQTSLPKFGKFALQESSCTAIDTVAMFRYVTRFSTLVSHPDQLETKLISAILAAQRAPRGPAHLSVPSDVLAAPVRQRVASNDKLLRSSFCSWDEAAVDELAEQLASVNNLVVYLGGGVRSASAKVLSFIEATGAAFVAAPSAKGWVDETHPQYHGVYGFAGHESARKLLARTDVELVLAVGSSLGELDTGGWHGDLLSPRLVHVDSVAEHFARSPMASRHVLGDVSAIFGRLLERVRDANARGVRSRSPTVISPLNATGGRAALVAPEKCDSQAAPIKPQRLMARLSQHLPDDTRLFVDAGNSWCWATHYLTRRDQRGFYRISMAYGSMAWAVGAAIGSAVANPNVPTLCLVGDGSYLMSAQELTVAVQLRLGVVFLVVNDAALGMVMHGQRLGEQEPIGWELSPVDFAAMARATGARAEIIDSPEQLDRIDWQALFAHDGPTLLDVRIDREEVPPMQERVRGLSAAR